MIDNIQPRDVWEALRSDPQAQLVDVRQVVFAKTK